MGWKIIPIISIVVTAAIFATGRTSLYNNAIATVISKVTLSNDSLVFPVTYTMGVSSPKKGKLDIVLPQKVQLNQEDEYYNSYYSTAYFDEEVCYAKVSSGLENTAITYTNRNSWESNSFMAKETIALPGGISDDLKIENGRLVGAITNESGINLEDTVLYLGGEYIRLGEILAGDTKEIDQEISIVSEDYYYQISKAFGMDPYQGIWISDLISQKKITKEDAYYISQRISLLENMASDNPMALDFSKLPITLYAFTREPLFDKPILVNQKQAGMFHHTVFVKDMSIDLMQLKNYEIPFGLIRPIEVVSNGVTNYDRTQFDRYNNYLYIDSSGPVECIFSLPLDTAAFTFQWEQETYMPELTLKQIYNIKDNSWEMLSSSSYDRVGDYVDELGTVRIRGELVDSGELSLPKIQVKGGE